MKGSEISEFGLIRRLATVIGAEQPPELIAGIGDDAAAWRLGEQVLLATTDTLVSGVHFLPDLAPLRDVGWKALAVNVSDIAAMGGEPLFALVTLMLPAESDPSRIDDLYAGMAECASEYRVTIAGGDIVRADEFAITAALIGRTQDNGEDPLLMRRSGARAGDTVAVSGTLGDSAAGLRLLRDGAATDDPLVRTHLRPHPPLALGQLAARSAVTCAIDVSDGLLQDVGHITEMSGVSATLHAGLIPISDAVRSAYPEDALSLACTGGEDYQLVLVGDADRIESLKETGEPITIVGEMSEGPPRVVLLDANGNSIEMPHGGWDHLRPS